VIDQFSRVFKHRYTTCGSASPRSGEMRWVMLFIFGMSVLFSTHE